jgi:hypothetical protein
MFLHRNFVACGVCFVLYICYDFFQAEQLHLPRFKILGGGGGGGMKGVSDTMSRAGGDGGGIKGVSDTMSRAGNVTDVSHTMSHAGNVTDVSHSMSRTGHMKDVIHKNTSHNMSHNIIMHTSGIDVEFERLMFETASQLVGWLPPRVVPILHHDQLLRAVATTSSHDLKETTATAAPPKDYYNTTHTLGMYRLAQVISDLEAGKKKHVQVLVIGGSMTAGHAAGDHPGAWPRKLEILLQALWGPESFTVTNIARPAVPYNYWLQNFARIVEFGHFDIIIGDFAVNDQVDYDKQNETAMAVNKTQYSLLNQLVHLPFRPAVLLVESFRTAGPSQSDANRHCGQNRKKVDTQWICPQWWMPQTWREQAVRFNSVPIVSYRDAVWPLHEYPPTNIEYYWDGLSHPLFNAHVMMAEALLFGFLAVQRNVEGLLKNYDSSDFPVPILLPVHDVCVHTTTKYLAENGNNDTSRFPGWNSPKDSYCWQYRADSRDKFGWIAETSKKSILCAAANHSALFQVNMDVGESGIVILSYLASYDERMASALVWIVDENGKPLSSNYTISSWHKEQTSLEATTILHVPKHSNFTTVNVELLAGTSHASQRDSENGVDKFKLLGLISC